MANLLSLEQTQTVVRQTLDPQVSFTFLFSCSEGSTPRHGGDNVFAGWRKLFFWLSFGSVLLRSEIHVLALHRSTSLKLLYEITYGHTALAYFRATSRVSLANSETDGI